MVTEITEYGEKWIKAIRESKTDTELEVCINKIYDEGFTDGTNETPIIEEDKEKNFIDRD